jgi:virulence-associated protein VapD
MSIIECKNKSSTISLKNETKEILEKSYEEYQKKNINYYNDVLKLMNMIFNDNSKSILKIKLKKITISEDIFELYNNIIKKYKLNKPLFDTENFDLDDSYDFTDIIEIIKIMCNNILIKLNYNLDIYTYNKEKKLKINIINNGF